MTKDAKSKKAKFSGEIKSPEDDASGMTRCDEKNSSLPRRRGAVVAENAASSTIVLRSRM